MARALPRLILLWSLWQGAALAADLPARRVISLAPHLTELMFAAGAGKYLIATVDYSDYPAAARALPRVGNAHALDLERIVAARPDLVLVWSSGNPGHIVSQLQARSIPVAELEISQLGEIPQAMRRIGRLTGVDVDARSQSLQNRIEALQPASRPRRVFMQIWDQPLMTVSNRHFIGDLLQRCGLINVFGTLPGGTPTVSIEAVVAGSPELIIASGMADTRTPWLDAWRRWRQLPAVRNQRLHAIDGDLIARPGPRLIEAAEQVCALARRP